MSTAKSRGSALLTTLLVLSFTAITIMVLVNIQQILTFRTEQTIRAEQNFHSAMWVQDWASTRLMEFYKLDEEQQKQVAFPIVFPPQSLPYGTLSGSIEYAESSFNVNNFLEGGNEITKEKAQEEFVAGLTAIYPETSATQATRLYDFIMERQATKLFLSVSELRPSNALSPADFDLLSNWMIALPGKTKININLVPAPGLVMLTKGRLTLAGAQNIVDDLQSQGWISDLTSLLDQSMYKDINLFKDEFSFEGKYFWVVATIQQGKNPISLYTLVKAEPDKEKLVLRTIWRSYRTR